MGNKMHTKCELANPRRATLFIPPGLIVFLCCVLIPITAFANDGETKTDIRVGASAVNLKCDGSMVLAGMIEGRYAQEQEGELRAVAVVVEKPGVNKIAFVACDVLWIPRRLV